MVLHRNESSSQKTLTLTGMYTYVKEKYNLSRELVTVFIQFYKNPSVTLKPEFVSKGKGTRTELHPPEVIKFNWAPKRFYCLEQMLRTISNLPNKFTFSLPRIMSSTSWITTVSISCARLKRYCWNVDMSLLSLVVELHRAYKSYWPALSIESKIPITGTEHYARTTESGSKKNLPTFKRQH